MDGSLSSRSSNYVESTPPLRPSLTSTLNYGSHSEVHPGSSNEREPFSTRDIEPLSVSRDQYNAPSLRVTVHHGKKFEYSEGSDVEKDLRNTQVEDLYTRCYSVARRTNRKAIFYKTLNICTALYIIFAAAFVAGLAPEIGKEVYGRWIIVVLGISIAITRGIASVFPFEQRSALLKESSTRALKLGRNVAALRGMSLEKLRSKLKKYEDELDELNFKIFVNNLVTGNGTQSQRSVDSVSVIANDDTWSGYTEVS